MESFAENLASLIADGKRAVCIVASEHVATRVRAQVFDALETTAFLEHLQILPLDTWHVSLWDTSLPEQTVLRPIQLQALAQAVIEQSGLLPDTVLHPMPVIKRFVEAYNLAERYGIAPESTLSQEIEPFSHWRDMLNQSLVDSDALAASQLPSALLTLAEANRLEVPAALWVACDVELTRVETALIDALVSAGAGLTWFSAPTAQPGTLVSIRPDTFEEEVDDVAKRVAHHLCQHRDDSPPPRIGVVTASLDTYQEPLRRAFERHVFPYAIVPGQLPDEVALEEPWRIGRGTLDSYPVIASAMDILGLGDRLQDIEHLSRLLRSDFLATTYDTLSQRESLDFLARERLPSTTSIQSLGRLANRAGALDAIAPLVTAAEVAQRQSGKMRPSEWVRQFDNELSAAGWPNRDPGDDVVDQARTAFSQVMDTLRALDYQLGSVSRQDAISWLSTILQSKRFELARDALPVIDVISLDDLPGRWYDALFVVGLSDSCLPRRPVTSPFLSKNACIAAGVPYASPEDCLARDTELAQKLAFCAPEVIVSCPRQNAEGVPDSPCLLFDWSLSSRPPNHDTPMLSITASRIVRENDAVRPLDGKELAELRGGTAIFKEFAISPILAFLTRRLHIKAFPERHDGLDAATQGQFVHDALRHLWASIGNQAALRALSPAQLEANVATSIAQATASADILGATLMTIERKRLQSLIPQWLSIDSDREEPFEVVGLEKEVTANAFGIPITLRLDRVDRVETGGPRTLVIDYKTGVLNAADLNAASLTEPQLPLYAVLGGEELQDRVDGIAVATIRDGECRAHLRSAWSGRLEPKRKPSAVSTEESWNAEVSAWRDALQAISHGFLAGDTRHRVNAKPGQLRYYPFLRGLTVNDAI